MTEQEKINFFVDIINNYSDERLKIELEIGDTIKLTNETKTILLRVISGDCKNCYCYEKHHEVCKFRSSCNNKIFTLISEDYKKLNKYFEKQRG